MKLSVNGKEQTVGDGATVATLLAEHKLMPVRVAVELNGNIVPRGDYAQVALKDGDSVEIVTLVGGG